MSDDSDDTVDKPRTDTKSVEVVAVVSLAVGVFAFLSFICFRKRLKLQYKPKNRWRNVLAPKFHDGYFGWLRPVMQMKDHEVLERFGYDAVMYSVYLRHMIIFMALTSFYALAVALPLNISGDAGEEKIYKLTMANIGRDQKQTYGHAIGTVFVGVAGLWCFARVYRKHIHYRHKYFGRFSPQTHAIMITKLPLHLRDEETLFAFFDNVFPKQISRVRIYRDLSDIEDLRVDAMRAQHLTEHAEAIGELISPQSHVYIVADREKLLDEKRALRARRLVQYNKDNECNITHAADIERPDAVISSDPSAANVPCPKRRWWQRFKAFAELKFPLVGRIWGNKVDSIQHYRREAMVRRDVARELIDEADAFPSTSVGIVHFTTIAAANLASQVLYDNAQPGTAMHAELAPEPKDIHFECFGYSRRSIRRRRIIVATILTVGIVFWSIPTGIVFGLANLDALSSVDALSWLGALETGNAIVDGIVQGLLPSFVLVLLVALAFFIIIRAADARAHAKKSQGDRFVLKMFFTFSVIQILFIGSIAGTTAQASSQLVDNPSADEVLLLVAQSLPKNSIFYLNYLMLQALGVSMLKLLSIGPLILGTLRLRKAITDNDYREAVNQRMFSYAVAYSRTLLVILISVVYSMVMPIVPVAGLVYLCAMFVVHRYKIMFQHNHFYDSGGQLWPAAYRALVISLLLFQVAMFALFISLYGVGEAIISMAMLILTAIGGWLVYQRHDRPFRCYPVLEMKDVNYVPWRERLRRGERPCNPNILWPRWDDDCAKPQGSATTSATASPSVRDATYARLPEDTSGHELAEASTGRQNAAGANFNSTDGTKADAPILSDGSAAHLQYASDSDLEAFEDDLRRQSVLTEESFERVYDDPAVTMRGLDSDVISGTKSWRETRTFGFVHAQRDNRTERDAYGTAIFKV